MSECEKDSKPEEDEGIQDAIQRRKMRTKMKNIV